MKIFAVYARVELIKKPDWLDDFRARYDEPYEFHVTLKQPCFIEDNQIPDVKTKLNDLFSNLKIPNHAISLVFDSLKVSGESSNNVDVLINAKNSEEIHELQKNILSILGEYNQYEKAKYKKYEENFEPHITIARNLDEQSFLTAQKILEQDYKCYGIINEITLIIVENRTVSEANDPKNQTIYML